MYVAYLRKTDANVIVLDWRRLAISDYVTAVRGVPDVGRGLGQFLRFLNQVTGAPFNTMHLAGFSLGGHLVGAAGRELGGRLARVTSTKVYPNKIPKEVLELTFMKFSRYYSIDDYLNDRTAFAQPLTPNSTHLYKVVIS